MGRIWLLAAVLYGYGDPGFDGHRPEALDRPLRNFHRAVDTTARDTRHALVTLDDKAQSFRVLVNGLQRLNNVF
jgi:hypothetical protein